MRERGRGGRRVRVRGGKKIIIIGGGLKGFPLM